MEFASDNTSGVAPQILAAITAVNAGYAPSYGTDALMATVTARLREVFEAPEAAIYLVATGTAANALSAGLVCPPWGAIYCHAEAHVEVDECGAPEFYIGGGKTAPVAGDHGRITPEALAARMAQTPQGGVHHIQHGMLSLTNLTEAGTFYRPGEVASLTAPARAAAMRTHMDGARFANAVAHVGCTAAEMSWKAGVEVLTLGTTKSGSFGAETIVAFTPKYADALAFLRKRSGHFAPKSRFLSAQVQAYVDDDLWLRNARHGNRAALRMAGALARIPGVELVHPTEGNEVFASMPAAMSDALEGAGCRFQRDWRLHPRHNRFVCSWATSDEEIEAMLAICRASARDAGRPS